MSDLTDATNIELESATNELLSVDRTDEAAANRWTKYGYDRLYLEGPAKFEKNSTYVNLETGELGDAPSRKHSAEVTIEGETATVEIHKDGKGHIYTLTLTVEGEGFEPVEDGGEDEPEVAADGGKDVTQHVDDETIEDAIEQHDDPDHEDALTVADVRDLLAHVQLDAEIAWGEWVDNIERDDSRVVAQDGNLVVLDTGEHDTVRRALETYDGPVTVDDIAERVISTIHHRVAEEIDNEYNWGVTYPRVVRLPKDGGSGQQFVEAIINSLMRRDLSPGQAWAYYGVEIRGHSRNQWATRCGYSDHSAVSEAVRKAKAKL